MSGQIFQSLEVYPLWLPTLEWLVLVRNAPSVNEWTLVNQAGDVQGTMSGRQGITFIPLVGRGPFKLCSNDGSGQTEVCSLNLDPDLVSESENLVGNVFVYGLHKDEETDEISPSAPVNISELVLSPPGSVLAYGRISKFSGKSFLEDASLHLTIGPASTHARFGSDERLPVIKVESYTHGCCPHCAVLLSAPSPPECPECHHPLNRGAPYTTAGLMITVEMPDGAETDYGKEPTLSMWRYHPQLLAAPERVALATSKGGNEWNTPEAVPIKLTGQSATFYWLDLPAGDESSPLKLDIMDMLLPEIRSNAKSLPYELVIAGDTTKNAVAVRLLADSLAPVTDRNAKRHRLGSFRLRPVRNDSLGYVNARRMIQEAPRKTKQVHTREVWVTDQELADGLTGGDRQALESVQGLLALTPDEARSLVRNEISFLLHLAMLPGLLRGIVLAAALRLASAHEVSVPTAAAIIQQFPFNPALLMHLSTHVSLAESGAEWVRESKASSFTLQNWLVLLLAAALGFRDEALDESVGQLRSEKATVLLEAMLRYNVSAEEVQRCVLHNCIPNAAHEVSEVAEFIQQIDDFHEWAEVEMPEYAGAFWDAGRTPVKNGPGLLNTLRSVGEMIIGLRKDHDVRKEEVGLQQDRQEFFNQATSIWQQWLAALPADIVPTWRAEPHSLEELAAEANALGRTLQALMPDINEWPQEARLAAGFPELERPFTDALRKLQSQGELLIRSYTDKLMAQQILTAFTALSRPLGVLQAGVPLRKWLNSVNKEAVGAGQSFVSCAENAAAMRQLATVLGSTLVLPVLEPATCQATVQLAQALGRPAQELSTEKAVQNLIHAATSLSGEQLEPAPGSLEQRLVRWAGRFKPYLVQDAEKLSISVEAAKKLLNEAGYPPPETLTGSHDAAYWEKTWSWASERITMNELDAAKAISQVLENWNAEKQRVNAAVEQILCKLGPPPAASHLDDAAILGASVSGKSPNTSGSQNGDSVPPAFTAVADSPAPVPEVQAATTQPEQLHELQVEWHRWFGEDGQLEAIMKPLKPMLGVSIALGTHHDARSAVTEIHAWGQRVRRELDAPTAHDARLQMLREMEMLQSQHNHLLDPAVQSLADQLRSTSWDVRSAIKNILSQPPQESGSQPDEGFDTASRNRLKDVLEKLPRNSREWRLRHLEEAALELETAKWTDKKNKAERQLIHAKNDADQRRAKHKLEEALAALRDLQGTVT